MAKFLSRMAGGTVEKEMMVQIIVETLELQSHKKYEKVSIEVSRGDKKESGPTKLVVEIGDGIYPLYAMFNSKSKFY